MLSIEKILVLILGSYLLFFGASILIWKNSSTERLYQNNNTVLRGDQSIIHNQPNTMSTPNLEEIYGQKKEVDALLTQISQLQTKLDSMQKEIDKQKTSKAVPNQTQAPIKSPNVPAQTKIFEALGAYPDTKPNPLYNKPHLGIINDDEYCYKVDQYNLEHPENMFHQKNFFTDYPYGTLPRVQIMQKIGKLSMPWIHTNLKEDVFYSRKYNLSLNINNFFTNYKGALHSYHKIGSHFLCATQMYNHIPGNGALIQKDSILDSLDVYAKKYENKPQCFHKHLYFPKYFRLYEKEECQAFFIMINSQQYKESLKNEPIQYLVKIGRGSHKGEGVFLLDNKETKVLNRDYNEGLKCGQNKSSMIAQAYITNPLLLDMNNKFDFRLYVLIASTNPMIVYYHDGFLRVALAPFSKASGDKASHLTNTHLAYQRITAAQKKGVALNNMTMKQLEDYHLWSFEKLQEYLLKSGKTKDKNWLNNYLRPAFQKSIVHLMKMTRGNFSNSSNVYELHGVDFMLDADMNLWFIESNPSPLLTGTTKHRIYYQTVYDMFDIMYAYYKSRMKRVVLLIKKMKQALEPRNVKYWQAEYQKAVVNRLEPEFPVKKSNSWKLIMDENLPGAKAYFGLISEECVLG